MSDTRSYSVLVAHRIGDRFDIPFAIHPFRRASFMGRPTIVLDARNNTESWRRDGRLARRGDAHRGVILQLLYDAYSEKSIARSWKVRSDMHFGSYDDVSVELALEIANSRPLGRWPDELPDVSALARLLDRYDLAFDTEPTRRDLVQLHALRTELVAVFEATDVTIAAGYLNAIMDHAGTRPRLTDHDGEAWHLHYEATRDRVSAHIGAICAASLAMIVLEAGVSRFGICRDDDCESFFVDASKNVARRFCSQRCGTRTSVAAYRARKREAASG